MTAALIVSASVDADFAEEVRAKTRGLTIEIAPGLPADERRPVLLVWSAARPVTASDVPVLVELASRGRLVIARRDGTPLPAGLGDLGTWPPGVSSREAAFSLLQATLAPGQERALPPVDAPTPPPAPPPTAALSPSPLPPSAATPTQWSGAHWLLLGAFVAVLIAGGVILGGLGL